MRCYKLPLIASQTRQKETLGTLRAHTVTGTHSPPSCPPYPCHQQIHNDSLRNGHFQETAWRRCPAPLGAPGARVEIAGGYGQAVWPLV